MADEMLNELDEDTPSVIPEEAPDPIGHRIQSLKDINGDKIYPVTLANAVYMPGKLTTVMDEVKTKLDMSYETTFEGGNITKTYANKDVAVTEFNNGSITETYRKWDGEKLVDFYVKTTTFENGAVQVDVEYKGVE